MQEIICLINLLQAKKRGKSCCKFGDIVTITGGNSIKMYYMGNRHGCHSSQIYTSYN